jgi:hypothetical protein
LRHKEASQRTARLSTTRPTFALKLAGLLLVSLPLVDCASDDTASENAQCESDCVRDYAGRVAACDQMVQSCLMTCQSPSDFSCVSDCEDLEFDCLPALALCTASCDCAQEVTSCSADCTISDTSCQIACGEAYAECAGLDSPFLCAVMCDATKQGCDSDCQGASAARGDYLACRQQCAGARASCLGECGG